MDVTINASVRELKGKGSSRRLRKAQQIPGVIYGLDKTPVMLQLGFFEITNALKNDIIFSHVIDLKVGKTVEQVLIKDLQRHPARKDITHIDFLRVDAKTEITANIPLHFTNADDSEAVRLGAVVNTLVTSLEITCLPKDLPESIAIDVSQLALGEGISLTGIKLPKGVTIVALTHGDIESHDATVVSIIEPRVMAEEVEEVETTDDAEATDEDKTDDKTDSEDKS
jgi:large subunit ribosomal protein L25